MKLHIAYKCRYGPPCPYASCWYVFQSNGMHHGSLRTDTEVRTYILPKRLVIEPEYFNVGAGPVPAHKHAKTYIFPFIANKHF